MTPRLALFLLLGIDAAILLFEASALSLTHHGAKLLYAVEPSAMTRIIQTSIALFGQNDVALRLPMIVMNLISALLLYAIAGQYCKHERERVWLVAVFLLLPGIISASLLVDDTALVILGLFLYLFLQQRYGRRADLLLPLLVFIDASVCRRTSFSIRWGYTPPCSLRLFLSTWSMCFTATISHRRPG
ncbi:MAG: glycosyltransferase family 39 protein [Campylobacterales bacterium]